MRAIVLATLCLGRVWAQRPDIDAINAAAPISSATIPVIYVTAKDATTTATAVSEVISVSAAQASISAAILADEHALEKRTTPSVSCLPQPSGNGHNSSPDTAKGFLSDPYYAMVASSATAPKGYTNTFTNLNASSNAYGYLGYSVMEEYDVQACAARCDKVNVCQAFNICEQVLETMRFSFLLLQILNVTRSRIPTVRLVLTLPVPHRSKYVPCF